MPYGHRMCWEEKKKETFIFQYFLFYFSNTSSLLFYNGKRNIIYWMDGCAPISLHYLIWVHLNLARGVNVKSVENGYYLIESNIKNYHINLLKPITADYWHHWFITMRFLTSDVGWQWAQRECTVCLFFYIFCKIIPAQQANQTYMWIKVKSWTISWAHHFFFCLAFSIIPISKLIITVLQK